MTKVVIGLPNGLQPDCLDGFCILLDGFFCFSFFVLLLFIIVLLFLLMDKLKQNKKDDYRQRNVCQFLQSGTIWLPQESRWYVVAFTRFAGGGIWLPHESLRHILASPGSPLGQSR